MAWDRNALIRHGIALSCREMQGYGKATPGHELHSKGRAKKGKAQRGQGMAPERFARDMSREAKN